MRYDETMANAARVQELRAELQALRSTNSPSAHLSTFILIVVLLGAIGGIVFSLHRVNEAEIAMQSTKKTPVVFKPQWTETTPETATQSGNAATSSTTPRPIMSPVTAIQ